MLFKKVSSNYYQAIDSKGNARRISKSRYLKETASKKVSRKNKKSYSRAVLQQLGGFGKIDFKNVNSLAFIAESYPDSSFANFGGWKLADRYTRQALDSVLANYNFGSLNAGREVGFCFVDCDGNSHTRILNAKDGNSGATLHLNGNIHELADAATSDLSQFKNPFKVTNPAGDIINKRMVGNFIGMSDIVADDITSSAAGVASGANLPSPKNKRIWIMIVKVNEPNNCTIGEYNRAGGPNNYFSGRTMYRYYRCMPIYQNGTIGTAITIQQDRIVIMHNKDGSHISNSGPIDVLPGTIIGFANFQEITILELASHQGNVLGYMNKQDIIDNAGAAGAGPGGSDWVYGTANSMQQRMKGGTYPGIYNEKTFKKWDDYIGGNNNVVSVGILGDVGGGNVNNANNSFINSSSNVGVAGGEFVYGTNSDNISANQSILNGAVTDTNTNTNLNRTTWIGCHSSVHWSRNDINIAGGALNIEHSNHAILARLLRKYNDTTQDKPGLGGGIGGSKAEAGTWDGSARNKPVWLPSIINKSADSVIKSELDAADDGESSTYSDLSGPGSRNGYYSLAGEAGNDSLAIISGYRAAAGSTLYVTSGNNDNPTYNNMRIPNPTGAGAAAVQSRTLLFL